MKIKLCGFTDSESVKAAIAKKCDFLGFVFFNKSLRNISPKDAAKISLEVPKNIAKVAVLVDPEFSFLEEIAQDFSPDFFQFHGNENVEYLSKVRQKFPEIKIIKAFRISKKSDLDFVNDFTNVAELFLFDSKVGGSGKSFDWKILQDLDMQKDWFLSGGLNIHNISDAIKSTGAKMIDVSSGIEEIKGEKSIKLISDFVDQVRS